MSELFSIYEDNLNSTFTKLNNINLTFLNLSKEKTEIAIIDGNNHITEAKSLLKKLEIESSSSNKQDRLMMKINNYKTELENIKKQFNKNVNNYVNQKSNEAIGLNSEDVDNSYKNKNLVDNEELAYQQHSKLHKALGNVLEIEGRGHDVMRQLDHQTNMMKGINNNLDDMNDQLGQSNTLLAKMMKRENRNKIVIIIAVLAGITILGVVSTLM